MSCLGAIYTTKDNTRMPLSLLGAMNTADLQFQLPQHAARAFPFSKAPGPEQVDLASISRDMPRSVPLGRWDCDQDTFTPATKMSTRFAGFMTG